MTDFNMVPVSSSQIDSIGYDHATQALRIKFKDYTRKKDGVTVPGALYEYASVPAGIHAALMQADADPKLSVGTHFGTHIKGGGFDYKKVE